MGRPCGVGGARRPPLGPHRERFGQLPDVPYVPTDEQPVQSRQAHDHVPSRAQAVSEHVAGASRQGKCLPEPPDPDRPCAWMTNRVDEVLVRVTTTQSQEDEALVAATLVADEQATRLRQRASHAEGIA